MNRPFHLVVAAFAALLAFGVPGSAWAQWNGACTTRNCARTDTSRIPGASGAQRYERGNANTAQSRSQRQAPSPSRRNGPACASGNCPTTSQSDRQ